MKFVEYFLNVVERVRPQGVTAELRNLPGRQILEYALYLLAHFDLEALNFLVQVDGVVRADIPELVNLGLQLGNRLLKIKVIGIH